MSEPIALRSHRRSSIWHWLWWGLMAIASIGVIGFYIDVLDGYEIAIVILAAVGMGWVGQYWPAFRLHGIVVGILSLVAIALYGLDLTAAEDNALLSYLLASQSAIMWMSTLYVLATLSYFIGLFLTV